MQEQQLLENKDAGQIESDGNLQEGSEILSLPIERVSFQYAHSCSGEKASLIVFKFAFEGVIV